MGWNISGEPPGAGATPAGCRLQDTLFGPSDELSAPTAGRCVAKDVFRDDLKQVLPHHRIIHDVRRLADFDQIDTCHPAKQLRMHEREVFQGRETAGSIGKDRDPRGTLLDEGTVVPASVVTRADFSEDPSILFEFDEQRDVWFGQAPVRPERAGCDGEKDPLHGSGPRRGARNVFRTPGWRKTEVGKRQQVLYRCHLESHIHDRIDRL